MHTLRGRVVLLVDDDLREARQILQFLRLRGASVLGPVRSAAYALEIIQTERAIDYAIVECTLHASDTCAVADALLQRQIPFVFLRGADDPELPAAYSHIPSRSKPLTLPELAETLMASPVAELVPAAAQRAG